MSALASYYLHVNALLHRRLAIRCSANSCRGQAEVEWLFERRGGDAFAVFQNQVLTIGRVAGSVRLHDSRPVRRVLQNGRFLSPASAVVAGAMRDQRHENDNA